MATDQGKTDTADPQPLRVPIRKVLEGCDDKGITVKVLCSQNESDVFG